MFVKYFKNAENFTVKLLTQRLHIGLAHVSAVSFVKYFKNAGNFIFKWLNSGRHVVERLLDKVVEK